MSGGITATTVMSYAALAGTALSAVSAIQQGNQAKAQANSQAAQATRDAQQASVDSQHATQMGLYQQRQAEADAAVQQSEAQLQARQIRTAGEKQRAAARASLAASGVTVGVGTSEIIDKEINTNAEQDALMSIYGGDTRAQQIRASGQIAADQGAYQGRGLDARSYNLKSDAAEFTARGKNAQTAGYLNAGASALSGIGRASQSWSGTAARDPIGDFYNRGKTGSGS